MNSLCIITAHYNHITRFSAIVTVNQVAEEVFDKYPGIHFINRDTVSTIYRVLHIKRSHGLDLQSFLDLLQHAGEELVTTTSVLCCYY